MSGFWLTLVLLLLASCLLLLIAGGRKQRPAAVDRDQLNTSFYYQRLRELEQDEAQGVVGERGEMVRELQQALLLDIPPQQQRTEHSLSRWVLLPGVLIVVLGSLGFYFKTGGFAQVVAWQQAQQALPTLRAQLMNPGAAPLTQAQLAQLGLGVRTSLQKDPHSLNDWLLLGRIGMVLNNASTAIQAFQHALQLAPGDAGVKLSYADVLARSPDPQDNRQAGLMLNEMIKDDGNNLRMISLLAFNAFSQQHYPQAIAYWQKMLQLLPAEDRRRAMIQHSIQQARSESGQQISTLTLSVSLSAAAERMLPADGILYISVTDGVSPIPVAVKKVPLSRFPISLTLDDSNAMMPQRLLSALTQVQVRARISPEGSASPQTGNWFGQSAVMPLQGNSPLNIEINQQQP